MTKAEARCVSLSKLGLRDGDTVYDVGAGTGSVSVEAALAIPGGRVFAIERDQAAVDLIKTNRRAFGARNLELVEGEAPEALSALPAPDAVFIGGSGGNLSDILRAVL
jgi:precorrin-6Y C5,15-methyltransferase (decarboxylating)